MIYRLAADAVVLVHIAFVLFVVAGGFLGLRWPWVVWLHLPAALWGGAIELGGWICPLTPLENRLRTLAGDSGYAGGFIEHYLIRVLYPENLTRGHQIWLGSSVLLLNLAIYGILVLRWRRRLIRED